MNVSKKLGFAETTKLLIIHADDAGLSHAENMATIQSLKNGIVNSYSIMIPCPWFYEMALFARSNPHYDCGIHLTLTCEWEKYKFGPVLPISEVPSLVNKEGYFFKNRDELNRNATTEDVKKELKAQIEKAYEFGLNPTHIDSHMYSVGVCSEFFEIYKDLGNEFGLPVLINKQLMEMVGLDPSQNIKEGELLIEKAHFGKFEYFESGTLEDYYSSVLDNLGNGLNIILIHPAFDDDEMKGVTINHPNFGSEWRQIDFDFFTNDETKSKLKENDIQLITWKDIKNVKEKMQNDNSS